MAEGPGGEGLARERVIRCCEDSLRRLQTDHIDLYQTHSADLKVPIEETLGALDQLVKAGKVQVIGASNYPAWRLMEALAQSEKHGYARFNSYQPEYSLMERALFETQPSRVRSAGITGWASFHTRRWRVVFSPVNTAAGQAWRRPRHGHWEKIRQWLRVLP